MRNSNLELLRIVSMIMIVTLHTLSKGGALSGVDVYSNKYIIVQFLESMSIVAVNCYILISGYFSLKSKFSMKRFIDMYAKVLFYSVSITMILTMFGKVEFSKATMVKSFLPVLTSSWWYVSLYMVMYLLTPYFNLFLEKLNKITKKSYDEFIMILIIVFVLWPSISSLEAMFARIGNIGIVPVDTIQGYTLYQFMLLYIVGNYIKRHYDQTTCNRSIFLLIYFVSISALCFINVFISRARGQALAILDYNFILVFVGSVSLFMYFKSFNFVNNIINELAKLTFGVYLIHEHFQMRTWLYGNFHYEDTFNESLIRFLLYTFIIIGNIYIVCSIIEYVRELLFKCVGRVLENYKEQRKNNYEVVTD